jgi:TrmH family RNA methyltransferase
MKTVTLTSPGNPLLKEIRRAVSRGELTRDGYCIAESLHLLEEALQSGCEIQAVLISEPALGAAEPLLSRRPEIRRIVLDDRLLQSVSSTETPQGVVALVRPPAWDLAQLFGGCPLIVVLDGIQDPGNAGAILRAGEAFAATGVVFLKGTVGPYHPKTVRASAGSVFRVALVAGVDEAPLRAALAQHDVAIYAAMPAGGESLTEADLTRRCAFVIGSEGRGVSERLRAGTIGLRIPVSGVESLNAAMAAGVLLYEARRQRTVT